jgi:PKHD-type hydroxylase
VTSKELGPLNLNIETSPIEKVASGGAWDLITDPIHPYAWISGLFNSAELDAIVRIGKSDELERGTTFGGYKPDTRKSSVRFLYPNELTGWIFQRIAGAVNRINNEYFQFDLSTLGQGLQFTQYESSGEHYNYHTDAGFGTPIRKLSMTIQLSDPNDYDGGDFELWLGEEPTKIGRERGLVMFFPSYVLHRVTPVTRGTRYSLVAWVSGPPFK